VVPGSSNSSKATEGRGVSVATAAACCRHRLAPSTT
jgi:hypothetical protein